MGISDHSCSAIVRSETDLELVALLIVSNLINLNCETIGLMSGLCRQVSFSHPKPAYHVTMDFVLCTGAQPYWNKKGLLYNVWNMTLSQICQHADALRNPSMVTYGASTALEKRRCTIMFFASIFTIGLMHKGKFCFSSNYPSIVNEMEGPRQKGRPRQKGMICHSIARLQFACSAPHPTISVALLKERLILLQSQRHLYFLFLIYLRET